MYLGSGDFPSLAKTSFQKAPGLATNVSATSAKTTNARRTFTAARENFATKLSTSASSRNALVRLRAILSRAARTANAFASRTTAHVSIAEPTRTAAGRRKPVSAEATSAKMSAARQIATVRS